MIWFPRFSVDKCLLKNIYNSKLHPVYLLSFDGLILFFSLYLCKLNSLDIDKFRGGGEILYFKSNKISNSKLLINLLITLWFSSIFSIKTWYFRLTFSVNTWYLKLIFSMKTLNLKLIFSMKTWYFKGTVKGKWKGV